MNPFRGLADDAVATKAQIEEMLETLIAHGDLFEYRDPTVSGASSNTIVFAAPCGFVRRDSGATILLGISADQLTALPEDLETRVAHVGHVRWLRPRVGEDLRDDLLQLGLIEIPYERWIKDPPKSSAAQHVTGLDKRLDAAQASGDVPELRLLDSDKPTTFYPARWVEPKRQSGRFVARRAQAYGAPVWCYVQMQDGRALRLLDFPRAGSRWRGCDDAWCLQMAIDALRQHPQRFTLRSDKSGTTCLQLFSPIPMWAQRRWDALGRRAESTGCLLAFELPDSEVAEEVSYAREHLWLEESPKPREGVPACP
ncbi:MAG: hypothetical protein AABZ53_05200 [Planctomycetota bacterium]